jgi:hypothetical protein
MKYLCISSYIRKPFLIWLCTRFHLNFLTYEENLEFFFISVSLNFSLFCFIFSFGSKLKAGRLLIYSAVPRYAAEISATWQHCPACSSPITSPDRLSLRLSGTTNQADNHCLTRTGRWWGGGRGEGVGGEGGELAFFGTKRGKPPFLLRQVGQQWVEWIIGK